MLNGFSMMRVARDSTLAWTSDGKFAETRIIGIFG